MWVLWGSERYVDWGENVYCWFIWLFVVVVFSKRKFFEKVVGG